MINFELASVGVTKDIYDYVLHNLPNYNLMFAVKKSEYKDDSHLYMVVCKSKSDGSYAVWTCYNHHQRVMNHGHYCVMNLDKVYSILEDYYYKEEE